MSKKKYYLGICDSLDKGLWGTFCAWSFGTGGALALNTAFNAVAGRPEIFHNSYMVGMASIVGCLAATGMHDLANRELSRRQVGLRKGSRIVKKLQALAFSVPVVAALTFNAVSDTNFKDAVNPLSSVQAIDRLPQAPSGPVPAPSQSLPS